LLLVLIPWSAFWDRNLFLEGAGTLASVMTSNYTRGAVTGLGLINVWAALGELGDMFGSRGQSDDRPSPDNHHSPFSDHQ
jgi:hypothetical protein